MELWDLRDADGRLLQRQQPRGQALPAKTHHAIVGIWTLHQASGRILSTKRVDSKQLYPGSWEITGGAVLAGESPAQGAARELREETGLACDAADLLPLGRLYVYESIAYVFVFRYHGPLDAVQVLPSEISDYAWFLPEEIEEKIANDRFMPPLVKQYRSFQQKILSFFNSP